MALLLTLTACGSSSSELLDTSTTGDFVLPFSGKTVKNDDTGKKNHNNDDDYDSIWNIYVGARYSALDIPFENYYDYIYNQVLLNQLNIMQGHYERIVLCLIS